MSKQACVPGTWKVEKAWNGFNLLNCYYSAICYSGFPPKQVFLAGAIPNWILLGFVNPFCYSI